MNSDRPSLPAGRDRVSEAKSACGQGLRTGAHLRCFPSRRCAAGPSRSRSHGRLRRPKSLPIRHSSAAAQCLTPLGWRDCLVLASWLHRFASLGLKSGIDAALGSRTAAVPWRVPYAAAGECRMGRDFGRRSRPWLREREGPAAQRREGKHRRCAPVRSPCPQADSDAGTRSLPAGRLGRGNTVPARRQSRPRERPLPAGRVGSGNSPLPAGRPGRRAETISCGSAAR